MGHTSRIIGKLRGTKMEFNATDSATNNTTDNAAEMMLKAARRCGTEMHIDLWYPNYVDSSVKSLVVGLMDVRAADSIRISYDKARDGWKIEQASTFSWDEDDDTDCDPDWQEVAFVQAWAREKIIDK